MLNRFFSLLPLLLWLILQATPLDAAEKQHKEQIKLCLKWLHDFQFAGYYAAKEKGFYADEQLEVNIHARKPNEDNIEQILSHQCHYGIADTGLIQHRLNGKPVVVLASIFQHNPLVYISLKSSGIVSPYEMKGKRVMDDVFDRAPLLAMLYEAGVSYDEFTHYDNSFAPEDLLNNKVDVISGYLTDQINFYKSRGVDINIIDPRNYGIDFIGDNLFTTEQEIAQHPERVERFLRASLKGWDYALRHSDEVIQIILDRYNTDQHLTKEHLQFEARQTAKMIMANSIPIGNTDSKRFIRIAETYRQLGLVSSTDRLKGFIYGQGQQQQKLIFTDAEKAWLKAHPVIRVGIDSQFIPYEWLNTRGNYVGLSADYMAQIEKRLGVKFEIVKDKSWAETLEMAQKGQLDMLANANKTEEREKFLYFTEPYLNIPIIIIDNGLNGFVGTLNRLEGKRVAIERSYYMQELLEIEHPKIQLIPVNTIKDALYMVSRHEADAYVGDAASANYAIKKEGLLNLSIAGETNYRSWHRMAVSKKNPELVRLLSKALADIPITEKEAIKNRWLSLTVQPEISTKSIIKYGIAALLLLAISVLWNLRLQREMQHRKNVEIQLRKKQQELSISQEQLNFALKGANDGLWDWNLETDDVFYSARWKNMLGYSDEGLLNRLETWANLVHPDDKNKTLQQAINYLSGNLPKFEVEFRMRHKQGHWVYILSRARLALDNSGNLLHPKRLIGTHVDITERKQAEEELCKAASVFANTQEGIVITDINANIIDTNQAFSKITGYAREEVLGRNPSLLKSGHHDDEFYRQIWQTIKKQGFWTGEIWNRKKSGVTYVEWLTISAVTNENAETTHFIGTFTDITELKEHEQQLKRIAHFDPLTGVPNRILLADRMQLAVAQTKREECMMVVGYIDLDGFKPVNDRWGHEAGDQLLIEITNRIKQTLREGDTIARLGGDEFVFLLLNLEIFEECEIIIHRL
ncbi:MAG: ABC transporter substrate-binding protein, partial [Methylococcales bacterium]